MAPADIKGGIMAHFPLLLFLTFLPFLPFCNGEYDFDANTISTAAFEILFDHFGALKCVARGQKCLFSLRCAS